MIRSLSVMCAAFAIAACSNPVYPASDLIRARGEARTLMMTNISSDPVYYFAADREALALLDWAVCTDPSKCQSIPAQSTKAIAYSQIAAYQLGSKSAVVYHWRLVSLGLGRYKPDSIRAVVVNLN
jgi:hypothetical protein